LTFIGKLFFEVSPQQMKTFKKYPEWKGWLLISVDCFIALAWLGT